MAMDFSQDDIPFSQIMDAFLEQYLKESQVVRPILESLDETERREAIAQNAPYAAAFLEGTTQAELGMKLTILCIAASVAEAVVEGNRILH